MASLLISGGRLLDGEIEIQGSKNAVLPLMAAALLLPGTTRLSGCPRISDVFAMAELLKQSGAVVWWEKDTLCIDAAQIHSAFLAEEEMKKTRAGVLLLGALLGRTGSCEMAYPGGCAIGSRPINLHLTALREMGYRIREEERLYCDGSGCPGARLFLKFPSVGATQNILLAAATLPGITEVYGAAQEPEVQELCLFLQKTGARIWGIGTKNLQILGNEALRPVEYAVPADRIVTGTYLTAVLAAGGEVMLRRACAKEQTMLLPLLRAAGARVIEKKDGLWVYRKKRPLAFDYLATAPYPGFPTDMQSQMMALASICDGTTILEETVFEARLATAAQLKRMGADIYLEENRAIVNGVQRLHGAQVNASDLRGAAALVIAGLAAEGTTKVLGYHYLQRGYEDIVRDLRRLGAELTLCKDDLAEREATA